MCQSHVLLLTEFHNNPWTGREIYLMTKRKGFFCAVDICERPAHVRGWCDAHYRRWQKTGNVFAEVPLERRIKRIGACYEDGCGRPIDTNGLCVTHSRRLLRFGSILSEMPICDRFAPPECMVQDCHDKPEARCLCRFHYGLVKNYNVAPGWYDETFVAQKGVCHICENPEPRYQHLAVDHDHRCCPGKRSCGKNRK